MKISELTAKNLFDTVNDGGNSDTEITKPFACDLLSFAMSKASSGCAWFTVMGNVTSIGVAVLADVACIILTENAPADADAVKRAEENEVIILGTDKNSYQIAVEISKLI